MIHMDNVDCQLQLATRFMQPTVTSFEIQIYNPSTHMALRGGAPRHHMNSPPLANNYELIAQFEHSNDPSPEGAFPDHLLEQLCPTITDKMPRLTTLQFFVEDVVSYTREPTLVHRMVLGLPALRNLELAHYQVTARLFGEIAAHPSLNSITRYRHSTHLGAGRIDTAVQLEVIDPAAIVSVLGPTSLANVHTLYINIGVDKLLQNLQTWHAQALPNLRYLDIDTEAAVVSSNDAVVTLFAAIASRFSALDVLIIGPIHFLHDDHPEDVEESLHVNAQLLTPLTALKQLSALTIRSFCYSHVRADEWPALLQSWPRLRHLVLDQEPLNGIAPGIEMTPGTAPIDTVLDIFAHYCPLLQTLSLHVDGTLTVADPTLWAPLRMPLRALQLVLPRTVSWGTTDASQLAHFLKAVLHTHCGLHVTREGANPMCFTLCVGPTRDVGIRECYRLLHDVMNKWLALQRAEGRSFVSGASSAIRGDLLFSILPRGGE